MKRSLGLTVVGLGALCLVPQLASGSNLAEFQDVGNTISSVTGIFYLIGGLIVIGCGIYAILKFASGREHLVEGSLGMAGAALAGVFMWKVIPLFSAGIVAQASAATLDEWRHTPPAIVQEVGELHE